MDETFLQMVHHGTYHCGQVACLLKFHGVDFPDTDYLLWINQSESEAH